MKYKIYTDGACSGNPGKGGWAAIILNEKSVYSNISGGVNNTTNNRMELTAPIMALNKIKKSSEITIYTDSKYVKDGITEWGEENLYQGYQSENEVFLAVAQGKADLGITTNTAVKPITEQYDNIDAGPRMPWTTDYTSVVGKRTDISWLNYLNLFVTHQVRSGRYQELWGKFVGGEAPELRIPGVMY